MKDTIWKLISLGLSVSIAFAVERSSSIWMPSCSSSLESNLIAHPADCRKFYVCIQGITYPVSCPYGLNWNPILKKCTTLSSCKNNQNNRIPRYNPLCPFDQNPENPTHLPDNNDCGQFYECQGGFAFHMVCPDQKHWSVEHESCEEPSIANCKVLRKTNGDDGQLNAACPLNDDPSDPTHLPHPDDCTKFLKCSYGRSYIVPCPFGLHWDVRSSSCESPFIAQCNTAKVTTVSWPILTASTVETSPSPPSSTAKPNSRLPICPKNGLSTFGIPGQCDMYFSCSQGKLYVMNCREGRSWSETANRCVDSRLAGCTGLSNALGITTTTKKPSSRPGSYSNTQRPLVTTRPTSCTPEVGFLSHPTDCHKYIVCDNSNPVEMSCPDGLFFNHTTFSCQWTNVDC